MYLGRLFPQWWTRDPVRSMDKADVNAFELDPTAQVYRNVDLRRSRIGAKCTIGDDSFVFACALEDRVAINRRNHLHSTTIGRFTYTGVNTVIKRASIGRFCSISWNVSIGGKDHDYAKLTTSSQWWFHKLDSGRSVSVDEYGSSPDCVIGNDVWIASNVVILRGVEIGDGAVIGAGAVVTKDVAPYTIVAGVPAKPLRPRFDPRWAAELQRIAWWNWPVDVIRANVDVIYTSQVNDDLITRLKAIAEKI